MTDSDRIRILVIMFRNVWGFQSLLGKVGIFSVRITLATIDLVMKLIWYDRFLREKNRLGWLKLHIFRI